MSLQLPQKRHRDDDDELFDVEMERAALRAKRTRLARNSITRNFKKIDTLLEQSRASTIQLMADFEIAHTEEDEEEAEDVGEQLPFAVRYRECSDRLLAFEMQIGALRRALPDAFMAQQRVRAEALFALGDIRHSNGTLGDQSVLIVDPPWESDNPAYMIGTSNQYPTMSDEALCAMPIAGAVSEDCALLLWTTFPKLETAFRVLQAWGFRYQTVFMVWIKIEKYLSRLRMTHGVVTRPNAEIILIGTRGNMRTPLRKNFRRCNVLLSRPQEHSRKPELVKQIAVELYGDKPRMELFSRTQTLDWRCWGNEAGEFAQKNDGAEPEQIREIRVQSQPESTRHAAHKKLRRNKLSGGAFVNSKLKRLKEAPRRGNGGKLKASVKTLGYYTPHNCITKQHYIFHSDGAGTDQRELTRESYLEYIQQQQQQQQQTANNNNSVTAPRPIDCVSSDEIATNRHIGDYYSSEEANEHTNRTRHPLYATLTNQEVAENIDFIYSEQKRNSDKLFVYNYNKKKRTVSYPQSSN